MKVGRMARMTSRERVLASFEHREPDRVPVAFGNAEAWGIMDAPPYGYRSLCKYLGIHDYEEPKTNFLLIVNNCDERLTKRLNNDFIHINQGAPQNVELPGGFLRTPAYAQCDLEEGHLPLRRAL